MRKLPSLFLLLAPIAVLLAASDAFAQITYPSVNLGFKTTDNPTEVVSAIKLILMLTVLTLAPAILIMMTGFTRIIIVLSFLRQALGVQQMPPNQLLVGLALFLTFFVMGPAFDRAWNEGLRPLTANEITEAEAFERISDPFRDFMVANVRDKDFDLFADLARERGQADVSVENADFRILVPAFMISEIRRGFEIGFLIVLPFLVIDLIVATITMSMGMMMLPPVVVSLPFKILFFVLIDGWNLLVGSLVRSFA